MKRFAFLSLLIFISAFILPSGLRAENNPVADPAAVVTCGNARFTVLTDKLIRMEWSQDGIFEDRATLGIINRNLPVPDYKTTKSGSGIVIRTSSLTLSYKGNGKFSEDNLKVSFKMPTTGGKHSTVVWKPGTDDKGNLLGTARTLDECSKKEDIFTKQGMDKGVISRDGWAIIDESARHLLVDDDSDWKQWVAAKSDTDRQDLYIFAYGHDYLSAIKDFTKIAGSVPLPPKYVFGFWQSRYWAYSDYEFIDMARRFRREDIPADIMIIDMDWHKLWDLAYRTVRDEFGQRVGWTGYSWNRDLFPCPESTLAELHNLGFKTALNLHPASGINPREDIYEEFVKDYLTRTDDYDGPEGLIYGEGGYKFAGNDNPVGTKGQKAPVPFRIDQKEWADAYFNSVLHPMQKQGVDFWWLDWQQWLQSKYTKGLSNTFWLNHVFFNDIVRQSVSEGKYAPRPLIYHRWGGIGSHRYQVGFSGDTHVCWEALQMEPWFTATASNVCYGYWGHDLGGHMKPEGDLGRDPELFTRWLQYGVFTPIFKIHSAKNADIERRLWNYPAHSEYLKDAIRLRYSLSPYIYDAARSCHTDGISICRPLYYYAPEDDRSYAFEEEFFFGDNILATAVSHPCDSSTGLATLHMWFPEGSDWYDCASGRTFKGGTEADLKYTVFENPWFIKAGAIIPMASESICNLQEPSNILRILIAPGNGESSYVHYEDDGTTQAYETEYASTKITKESDEAKTIVRIGSREGSYRNMPANRKISVILESVFSPVSVKVNGKEVLWARFPDKNKEASWSYDGNALATVITLPETPASEEITVECQFSPNSDRMLLEGKKGILGRMTALTDEIKSVTVYAPAEYIRIAGCASRMTEFPNEVETVLKSIDLGKLNECWQPDSKMNEAFVTRMKAMTEQ